MRLLPPFLRPTRSWPSHFHWSIVPWPSVGSLYVATDSSNFWHIRVISLKNFLTYRLQIFHGSLYGIRALFEEAIGGFSEFALLILFFSSHFWHFHFEVAQIRGVFIFKGGSGARNHHKHPPQFYLVPPLFSMAREEWKSGQKWFRWLRGQTFLYYLNIFHS